MDIFPMHRVAEVGDLETMKHIINEGMSINILDTNNCTPLHSAAKCGHLEVLEFLTSQNIALDLKSKDGSTAVMAAAQRGHKRIVETLLRSGASVDGCSVIGKWTLLHHACQWGWTDIVKLLAENNKTELDAKTTLHMTPLLLAASEGHSDIVEILIKAGADVNCCDTNWFTVLHYACIKGWLHIVKLIIEINRSGNAVEESCHDPLLLAAREGHKDIVEFLIEYRVAVDYQDTDGDGWNVLHYACRRGYLQIVKKILKFKQSGINVKNTDGNTPLHIAVGMHNIEIVRELLKAGADVSIQNVKGELAIGGKTVHHAASSGDLEMLQCLIELGVSTETCDKEGFRPLHRAAETKELEVAKFLIHNNCDVNAKAFHNRTPLSIGVFRYNKAYVNLLIQSGADHTYQPEYCYSTSNILHTACQNGWEDTVKCIVESEKVNLEVRSDLGYTPLMEAATRNRFEVAKLLLEAGANVNACGFSGDTALHYACMLKNLDIVKVLLSAGADANLENSRKETPFHRAIERTDASLEIIKLLIQHGAYFRYSDDDKILKNNRLKELVLKDVDLCARLIFNKFNRLLLPEVYKNPEYTGRLPIMDRLCIGNSEGVGGEVASYVESEISTNTFCNVVKARPAVLTLMCVEALINPKPTKKEKLTRKITGPVKRSARLAALNAQLAKKVAN